MKSLYAGEITEKNLKEILKQFIDPESIDSRTRQYITDLYNKVLENKERIDRLIKETLLHWDFSRIALMDKNILRMAVCEFLFFPDIPTKVTIDEAIELAKKFSTADSGSFVNGVLDAIAKKQEFSK